MGSFAIEGFLNFIKSNKLVFDIVLKNYLFIIIPMVNFEGVIAGNSICNL
jgi:hypothetical protein